MRQHMLVLAAVMGLGCEKPSASSGATATATATPSVTSAPSAPGSAATQVSPVQNADAGPAVAFSVAALAAGGSQTCALATDGEARCWGDTGFLTMADRANNMQRGMPTSAPALDGVREIALGGAHGCARTKESGVGCWGNTIQGLLGDGTLKAAGGGGGGGGRLFCTGEHERCVPFPIAGLRDVVQISASTSHTCARLGAGTVLCWGQNTQGQLGDGTTIARPTPAAVTGLRDVAQIAGGGNRSCARLTAGTVSCWGESQPQPTAVAGLAAIADVVVGGFHACARAKDGVVQCWGDNSAGQLGDGTTERRATPAVVASLRGVTHLALGARHTCAAAAAGAETWCWGQNGNHALGDGTTDDRHAPARIVYR